MTHIYSNAILFAGGDILNINERIKHLRKDFLHMTQEEFASSIKISRSNLGSIEIGRITLTDRVISDICEKFNINESWLRTGEGGDNNIFAKATPYEKAYNRFGYIMENASSSKKAVLSMLLELLYEVPDDKWNIIMDQFRELKKEG